MQADLVASFPRFWSKVDFDGPVPCQRPELGPCWVWIASLNNAGYGQFKLGRTIPAHRVAYELVVGEIPDRMVVDHLCLNKTCVNPNHLEIVTSRENTMRGPGVASINARKTHCPQGHSYSDDNTSITGGERRCKTCRRDQVRRSRLKGKMKSRDDLDEAAAADFLDQVGQYLERTPIRA